MLWRGIEIRRLVLSSSSSQILRMFIMLTSAPVGTLKIIFTSQVCIPCETGHEIDTLSKTLLNVHDITANEASTIFNRFKVLNRDIAAQTHGIWTPYKITKVRF